MVNRYGDRYFADHLIDVNSGTPLIIRYRSPTWTHPVRIRRPSAKYALSMRRGA